MSVMIKGVRIPESCAVCFIKAHVCAQIRGNDKSDRYFIRMKSRRSGCPLVEIQTPHGMLIDINDVISAKSPTAREREKNEAIALYRAGRDAVIEAIVENAQIIIEAEGNNDEGAV